MPRVRRLDVFVPDHDAPRYRFAAAMAQLSTAYGQALLDLELTGPCSSIMIVAHRQTVVRMVYSSSSTVTAQKTPR